MSWPNLGRNFPSSQLEAKERLVISKKTEEKE